MELYSFKTEEEFPCDPHRSSFRWKCFVEKTERIFHRDYCNFNWYIVQRLLHEMPYTGFCYTSKQTYVFQTILSELLRITSYLFFVLDLSARSWWFLFLFIIVHYQYVFSEFSDYFYIFAPKWDFVSTYTPQLAITLSKWAIETPVQCGNLFKVMTSTSFCCLYC